MVKTLLLEFGGMHMKTPVLETERMILRPLKIEDVETVFYNWTSDEEVAKFMRWNTHENLDVTRAWIQSEIDFLEDDRIYNFGFVLKQTGELIGSGGLVYNEEHEMYELGYNLMKKYWNQGLATEAGKRIIEFGIQELKQTKFFCCHAKDNPASGKVMGKIGFVYKNDAVYYSWDKSKEFQSRDYILEI